MSGPTWAMSWGGHFTYFITVFLMSAGLFIVIARGNLIKKLVGLGIFQTSVYLLYIAPGKLLGGTAPILAPQWLWSRCSLNQCTQDSVASSSSSTVLNGPSRLTHSALYSPITDSAIALS